MEAACGCGMSECCTDVGLEIKIVMEVEMQGYKYILIPLSTWNYKCGYSFVPCSYYTMWQLKMHKIEMRNDLS